MEKGTKNVSLQNLFSLAKQSVRINHINPTLEQIFAINILEK